MAMNKQARIAQLMHNANQAMERWWQEQDLKLAKEEIVKQTVNPIRNLWWYCMPGTTITVKWPTGWTNPEPAPGGAFNSTNSADPNDHFRPFLEKHVGRQCWDWDWRLGKITGAQGSANGPVILAGDTLDIKFRWGREKHATMFTLLYG